MTKPMYCPMSLMATTKVIEGARGGFATELAYVPKPVICTPDCAWAVFNALTKEYTCAMAYRAVRDDCHYINWRSVKDGE